MGTSLAKKTNEDLEVLLQTTNDGKAMLNAINQAEQRKSRPDGWRRRQLEQAVRAL